MGVAAHAQLRVEIAGVGSNQIPVAVAAFADESMAPDQVSAIIRADLERSGVFKVIDAGQVHQRQRQRRPRRLEGRGADALVVGSVQPPAGRPLRSALQAARHRQGQPSCRSWADAVQPRTRACRPTASPTTSTKS
jgi:Tol biopolymer transport system component